MSTSPPVLGLRANWPQFSLLVLINAFVGGMVGMQRSIVPLLGEREFHITSATAVTTFIISFGVVKALANLFAGLLADRFTRKSILIVGWALALPVPFILMWADHWHWIVAANVLLGLNQGLAWSMTVVMKIDLVGPRRRGLALGLNESAGYLAVGLTAWVTGCIASVTALRPQPFYLGVAYAFVGLALSALVIRDTTPHARMEAVSGTSVPREHGADSASVPEPPSQDFRSIFAFTSFRSRALRACSQAGLINNLNDGVAWGLFPLLFTSRGCSLEQVALIAALYPVTWGLGQLFTGQLSDSVGRRPLIVGGMLLQAAAHAVIALFIAAPFAAGIAASLMLGIGTAMVYPVLLAAVADHSRPSWRARALAVYRFWRDFGCAAGALLAGLLIDAFSASAGAPTAMLLPIHASGILTFASGIVVWRQLPPASPSSPLTPRP